MHSDTQGLPRQRRPAWRLVGYPTILACRNRDLGTPAAGSGDGGSPFARRLSRHALILQCDAISRRVGVGSSELQGGLPSFRTWGTVDLRLRLAKANQIPKQYLPGIARQCSEKRCQVKPLHWVCRTPRVRLKGDRDLVMSPPSRTQRVRLGAQQPPAAKSATALPADRSSSLKSPLTGAMVAAFKHRPQAKPSRQAGCDRRSARGGLSQDCAGVKKRLALAKGNKNRTQTFPSRGSQ